MKVYTKTLLILPYSINFHIEEYQILSFSLFSSIYFFPFLLALNTCYFANLIFPSRNFSIISGRLKLRGTWNLNLGFVFLFFLVHECFTTLFIIPSINFLYSWQTFLQLYFVNRCDKLSFSSCYL